MKTVQFIEKEKIDQLRFSKKEVLTDPTEIQKRKIDLHRAQALGNLLQSKVNIIFETTDENVYQVSTTVWAVGEDFVTLKGGVNIPINSIHEIA